MATITVHSELDNELPFVLEPVVLRIRLDRNSSSHLYRGVNSPQPLGIVVQTERDAMLGTLHSLSITTPWGDVLSAKAVVHWSQAVSDACHQIGLRFINPSLALMRAVWRIAELFPTRSFDEPTDDLAESSANRNDASVEDADCPATWRSRCSVDDVCGHAHLTQRVRLEASRQTRQRSLDPAVAE